jgi:DNA-binding NarL/FixJ family response regulator
MPKTNIFIVDDHGVVIEGIKSAFRNREEYEVIGVAYSGRQAIEMVKSMRPDIVIMDISMTDINGVEATKQIKRLFSDTKIVIYTMFSNEEFVIELFKAGISGYVLKQDPFLDLMVAIDAVKAGGTYFSTTAPKIVSQHIKALEEGKKSLGELSLREQEVFKLLADGKSVKQIAEKLFISPKTVESHKYSIMAKLGAQSITDLTKIAIKHKLIQVS